MNTKPYISVIMPVYNPGPEDLKYAVQSILNQSFNNFEFIIINDGSTNNAEDIILSYDDKRIKYLKNDTNQKIIKTLNYGLDCACGKYIARLDADDFSEKSRFEKQVNFLDNHPDVGLLGSYFKIFPKNKEIIMPENPAELKLYLRYCCDCICHSSVMYRKSVLDEHNLRYDVNCLHAEDYKLWSDITQFSNVAVLPEYLTYYRHSPDGVSENNKRWQAKMVTVIMLDNMIKDFTCDKNYMYSILVKYIKGEPVSKKEHYDLNVFLVNVVNYLEERISPPFNSSVKNYILSILAYFIIDN